MLTKFLKKIFPDKGVKLSTSLQESFDKQYLFDFKAGYKVPFDTTPDGTASGQFTLNGFTTITVDGGGNTIATAPTKEGKEQLEKIAANPVDVVNEIETIPTPFSVENLPQKIKTLQQKFDLVHQSHTKRELAALIERLENRKKYAKHANFFGRFSNTTEDKIQALLAKYDLVMKASDIFIPEFPDAAIDIMHEYTTRVQKICKKKPVYYVIAPPEMFKKMDKKRDPILLVQSPFGFYYQILGAWDKEMLLLSEL